MPSFDGSATCTPANETVECRCSECFTWTDPGLGTANESDWFIVRRLDMDGTVHEQTTRHGTMTRQGVWVPAPRIWCPARDDEHMPIESRTYKYTVSGVNTSGTSPPSAQHVYVAAPYCIDAGCRRMTQGN